ncbi:hypothetical protein [Algoriphagus sp. CAU 1675]|uniref:hypothetical protein n=1 Tax=Algoriphagus sp. CAU 1675 TaxID=3032597 RepID=UPI0023DAE5B6|nr:hypothetical protein [Algoriphagus sp. CAU 1675]MDF2157787.1 hypothetical protein [Algoriphagus sp. CAU 1675]
MKRVGFWLLLTLMLQSAVFSKLFAQELSKEDYLEMSQKQKKSGITLLLFGSAMVTTGLIMIDGDFICMGNCSSNGVSETGGVLLLLGSVGIISGIPTLIKSSSNSKKAARLSLKHQPINFPRIPNQIPKSYPSISVGIPLD